MTNSELVIKAGRNYRFRLAQHGKHTGVQSILTGKSNKVLTDMATEHSQYQADHQTQGHQGWDERKARLMRALPGYTIEEIAAESWPENTRVEAATELFYSWERSPGHWSVANKRVKLFGYTMVKGRNGVYYGTGICAW